MRLKKGDTVLIISGKDRGKKSKVLQVFPKEEKVMVEGINLRKKHRKPKKSGEKGQIITLAGPISASNAKVVCTKCGKASRIGYKMAGKEKIRICKKCGEKI
jgi:large subunit ribosomal protein L24